MPYLPLTPKSFLILLITETAVFREHSGAVLPHRKMVLGSMESLGPGFSSFLPRSKHMYIRLQTYLKDVCVL